MNLHEHLKENNIYNILISCCEEGREEEPLFSSPDIFLMSIHSRLNLKYQISKGVKGKHKTPYMIQAHPCHVPCKYLSILDTFSGLMF